MVLMMITKLTMMIVLMTTYHDHNRGSGHDNADCGDYDHDDYGDYGGGGGNYADGDYDCVTVTSILAMIIIRRTE